MAWPIERGFQSAASPNNRRGPACGPTRFLTNHVAVSNGNDLFASEMEPHDVRRLTFFEMATHSIAHVAFESSEVVRFREDRFAKGSGRESAFGCFLDEED